MQAINSDKSYRLLHCVTIQLTVLDVNEAGDIKALRVSEVSPHSSLDSPPYLQRTKACIHHTELPKYWE